jgi:hypothetical protein
MKPFFTLALHELTRLSGFTLSSRLSVSPKRGHARRLVVLIETLGCE